MRCCGSSCFALAIISSYAASSAAQNIPQTTPVVASLFVTSFNLIGADALPPGLLDSALNQHTMQKKTLAELRKLATQLEKQLQTEHGLSSARVWVPLQEDKLGVVDIRILPGQIREVRSARNAQNVRETKALAILSEQFKPGSLLSQSTLEKTSEMLTKLLGETPLLSLVPTPTMGQFDLVLEPVQLEKYSLSVSVDNLGSRYTNVNRDKTQLQIRDSLFNADTITLASQFLTPNQKTLQSRYDVPLGLSNFKLGLSNTAARYQLVDAYAYLNAKGDTHITGADLSYQLISESKRNLTLRGEAQTKRSRTIQAGVPNTDRRIHAFNIGLYGDRPALGGTQSFNVIATRGDVDMSLVASDVNADAANIAGRYQKITARLEQSFSLGTAQRGQVNFSMQRARKNLDTTEAMLVGGISGVRAYPLGEAAADSGTVVNLEFHHRWNEHWRGLLFYDHGWASIRQQIVAGSTRVNNYDINGAGFSLIWSPSHQTELAVMPTWKLKQNQGADSTTGLDSDGRSSRLRVWFFATQQF